MRLQAVWQFMIYNLRPFQREKITLPFMILFPVLTVVIFSAAFSGQTKDAVLHVALDQNHPIAEEWLLALQSDPAITIKTVDIGPKAPLRDILEAAKAEVLVLPDHIYSLASPEETQQQRRRLLELREQGQKQALAGSSLSGPGQRLVDWMIPGLMGLMLFNLGFVGVGTRLAQDREGGLFKRLRMAPHSNIAFILGFSLSRLFILALEIAILLVVFHLIYDFHVQSSVGLFMGIALLGSFTFCLLGSAISARMRNTEKAASLCNIIYLLLMFLSGVYFDLSRFPEGVSRILQFSPLAAFNSVLRTLANTPSPAFSLMQTPLLTLAAWAVFAFIVTVSWFDWGTE